MPKKKRIDTGIDTALSRPLTIRYDTPESRHRYDTIRKILPMSMAAQTHE